MGNCLGGEDDDKDTSRQPNSKNSVLFPPNMRSLHDNLMYTTQNRGDVFDHYTKVKSLGEGSMGSVACVHKKDCAVGGSAYLVEGGNNKEMKRRHVPDDIRERALGKEYALKSILLSRIEPEFLAELRNEISILQTLDHPHIVRAYEVYETPRNLYLVLEYGSGGDLHSRSPYTESQAKTIIKQTCSAVTYLHEHNVVHRDLKYGNIIFESSNEGNYNIKLIDFGLSKKCQTKDQVMKEGCGTISTMSPQVLKGAYSAQADVWSIGVIAYMLLSDTMPFYALQFDELVSKMANAQYHYHDNIWKNKSAQSRNFIDSLLVYDEHERITALEALSHTWLTTTLDAPQMEHNDMTAIKPQIMNTIQTHLHDYGTLSSFKKLALMVIAHNSSTDEIFQLRKAFGKYDIINDGCISLVEFQLTMKNMKNANGNTYTEDEIHELFRNVDVSQDGKIHYTEFLAATVEVQGRIEEERLAQAFDRIDCDDTGFISRSNLIKFLGRDYTEAKIDALVKEADQNGDGKISFNEFLHAFRQDQEHQVNEMRDNK